MDDTTIPPDHRAPYRFIDEIVRYEKGTGITCKTIIRGDEPYLAGHFPGHPIVPGVFEIEMLFQAAELFLMTEKRAGESREMRLASIGSARFMIPIIPPRDLTVMVGLKEDRGTEIAFSGRVGDGPDVFVQALFSVTVL
ncbi:MAG: 3-hydroxyacyl-[acyl-carrier-protein] dehydratase FabZ [Deltaproteobacteria bacterium]|nr:3-hydroxyacyl-[acyl-carrier-protein] dehydratase FabZ [Candidatus Zymogenaceae bacterium]